MNSIYASMLVAAAIGGPNDAPNVSSNSITSCVVTKIEEIDVPAKERGILDVMEIKQGSLVRDGQSLARVDDEDAKLAVEISAFERMAAEMLAKDTVRKRAAVAQSAVSNADYSDAVRANSQVENTYPKSEIRKRKLTRDRDILLIEKESQDQKMAVIDVKSKKSQEMRARALLRKHLIEAPFDGEVTQVYKHAKEWVNPGDPVLHLVRMDKLRVIGFVPAADFSRHAIMNRRVKITVTTTGGGVEVFTSKITFVANEVAGGSFQVGAEIDNKQVNKVWLLNPGLQASMELMGSVANRRQATAR